MLRSFLQKRHKIWNGFVRTYIRHDRQNIDPRRWWDDRYGSEISDATTISCSKSQVSTMYHYASVELLILRHFANQSVDVTGRVFDIGSGAGHWIRFFKKLGASHCTGVDVSNKCVEAMRKQFPNDPNVKIHHGLCADVLVELGQQFDIINAIGVMFHIVDDQEWVHTIQQVGNAVSNGGLFIAGGHFGLLNNVNVQYDQNGHVNKRLRSRLSWRRQLAKSGFANVKFYSNPAYLSLLDTLPENNILIATK